VPGEGGPNGSDAHETQLRIGAGPPQLGGATQHVPGLLMLHGEADGKTCAHDAFGTPQSSEVVQARVWTVHWPTVLASIPSCWRTQSFQYVTPLQPQTGATAGSQRIGRGWHTPVAVAQASLLHIHPAGQSVVAWHTTELTLPPLPPPLPP
jgi:hypothetical protein